LDHRSSDVLVFLRPFPLLEVLVAAEASEPRLLALRAAPFVELLTGALLACAETDEEDEYGGWCDAVLGGGGGCSMSWCCGAGGAS
jgi:hypothetical protein